MRSLLPSRLVTTWALFAVTFTLMFAAGASASSTTVAPEDCSVTPLTESDLTFAATGTPVTRTTPDVSTGVAASPSDIDAITAVIEMSLACANANAPLQSLALFTPAYLQDRFGGEHQDDLGHLLAALTRQSGVAAVDDQVALVSIGDVVSLPDGRIAATVVTGNRTMTFTDTIVLAQVSGEWRIDQVILGNSDPIGTPTP